MLVVATRSGTRIGKTPLEAAVDNMGGIPVGCMDVGF